MKIKKINSMTKEQETLVPIYLRKWLNNGYRTDSIDKIKATESVNWLYEVQLKKSKPIVWFCKGPWQFLIISFLLKKSIGDSLINKSANLRDNLGDNLRANLGDNLGANLRDNLGDNLRANLRDNLGDNLEDNLRDNLEDNLRANLRDNLRDNLGDNLGANLRDNLGANLGDNLEANLGDNLEANLGANLGDNLGANLVANLRANLEDNLGANLGDNLRDNLEDNLGANLGDNLEDNLGANLVANLGANLRANLVANLRANLEANLGANLGDKINSDFKKWGLDNYYKFLAPNWQRSYYWWGWVGFYDFILNELFPSQIDKFKDFLKYIEISKELHVIYPYEGICFVIDRPKEINLTPEASRRSLHSETGPALFYRDGYSVFSLNGLRVPNWAIQTPKDQINPKKILALENTEQRTALMRYVGLDKFLKELKAEEIDSLDDYKLFYLTVEQRKIGPYLRMKDSSSSRVFLEGIGDPEKYEFLDPTIKTVMQALEWRAMKASKNFMTTFNIKLEGEA